MRFRSIINGYNIECTVYSIEKKKYIFDGEPFVDTIIDFDGIYRKDGNNYNSSYSLSVSK